MSDVQMLAQGIEQLLLLTVALVFFATIVGTAAMLLFEHHRPADRWAVDRRCLSIEYPDFVRTATSSRAHQADLGLAVDGRVQRPGAASGDEPVPARPAGFVSSPSGSVRPVYHVRVPSGLSDQGWGEILPRDLVAVFESGHAISSQGTNRP